MKTPRILNLTTLTAVLLGGAGGWMLHSFFSVPPDSPAGNHSVVPRISPGEVKAAPGIPAAGPQQDSETAEIATISLPEAHSAAFADLIRGTFRDPLKERRLGRLQILLEKCGPEHFAAMVPLIRENDLRGTGSGDEWSLLWGQWGQKAGAAAMQAVQELDWKGWDPAAPAEGQYKALSGWATVDPAAARRYLEEMTGTVHKGNPLSLAVLRGWSVTDPAGAADWLRQRGTGTRDEYRAVVEAMGRREGPEAVDAWLAGLGKKEDSAAVRGFAEAVSYAKRHQDPAAAAAWVEQHLKEPWMQGSPVIQNTASAYAQRDPAGAMAWAARTGLSNAAGIAMRQWCESDVGAACEWLQANRQSPAYSPAVISLVNRYRGEDPDAARLWANTIPDEALRQKVLETLPAEE